jgi:hypothetical protein
MVQSQAGLCHDRKKSFLSFRGAVESKAMLSRNEWRKVDSVKNIFDLFNGFKIYEMK